MRLGCHGLFQDLFGERKKKLTSKEEKKGFFNDKDDSSETIFPREKGCPKMT
jgi:hypothetical protein